MVQQGQQIVYVQAPAAGQLMPTQEDPFGLGPVQGVMVKQKVELLEAFTGFETENEYKVFNEQGQEIANCKEETGCCNRIICGSHRSFDLELKTTSGMSILKMERPHCSYSNYWLCFPVVPQICCLNELDVTDANGNLVGRIVQKWNWWKPKLEIEDASGSPIFEIEGPWCLCKYVCCPCTACALKPTFKIYGAGAEHEDENVVATIGAEFSGFVKEAFTDADNFAVKFPPNAPPHHKALLLATTFLLDYMYYEKSPSDNQNNAFS